MFQKSYVGLDAELGWDVLPVEEDNLMICGFTTSFGAQSQDMHVMRVNSDGEIMWERNYGGTGNDRAYSVVNSVEGGYLVGGAEFSFTPLGDGDIYLIKLTEEGDVEWEKTFGGVQSDDLEKVVQSADTSYFVGGRTRSYGAGLGDLYLLKIDKNGELEFSKTYGGNMSEICRDLVYTSANSLVLAGQTMSFGQGSNDGYIVKTNLDGDVLWSKTFGGELDDAVMGIAETLSGNYRVVGYTSTYGEGSYDGFIAEFDQSGSLVWSNTYGNEGNQSFYDGIITSDSGTVCTGIHFDNNGIGDLLLVKVDKFGTLEWSRTYTLTEYSYGNTVAKTSSGYVIVGSDENTNHNTLLVKTNFQGFTGCSNEEMNVNYVQNSFNPVIGSGGSVSSGCVVTDVNGESGVTNMTQDTICIQHCNLSLEVEVLNTPEGAGCTGEIALSVDGGQGQVSYQWDSNADNAITPSVTGLCVGEYCVSISDENGCHLDTCISLSVTVGIGDNGGSNWDIYPNPTSGIVELQYKNPISEAISCTIIDNLGQVIYVFEISKELSTVDLSTLNNGVYWIVIKNEKEVKQVERLILIK